MSSNKIFTTENNLPIVLFFNEKIIYEAIDEINDMQERRRKGHEQHGK